MNIIASKCGAVSGNTMIDTTRNGPEEHWTVDLDGRINPTPLSMSNSEREVAGHILSIPDANTSDIM